MFSYLAEFRWRWYNGNGYVAVNPFDHWNSGLLIYKRNISRLPKEKITVG